MPDDIQLRRDQSLPSHVVQTWAYQEDGSHAPVVSLGTPLAGLDETLYDDIPSSSSVVTLAEARTRRGGVCISNDSTAVLRVKLGAGAATDSFTATLAAKDANGVCAYYETPFGYKGIVTGIWVSANGFARVTEL